MKEKIQSALLHLKIVRIVSSVKISSFENVSEHFILTYINQDENSHDMLPLPPMPRTTQRSLKVFDESGNELPVIPSYQVHDALMELSKDYLAGILNHVEIGRDMQEEIEILKNSFDEIFKYGNVEERINEVEIILIHIRQYGFGTKCSEHHSNIRGLAAFFFHIHFPCKEGIVFVVERFLSYPLPGLK